MLLLFSFVISFFLSFFFLFFFFFFFFFGSLLLPPFSLPCSSEYVNKGRERSVGQTCANKKKKTFETLSLACPHLLGETVAITGKKYRLSTRVKEWSQREKTNRACVRVCVGSCKGTKEGEGEQTHTKDGSAFFFGTKLQTPHGGEREVAMRGFGNPEHR
jgi:hypothetical protein